MKRLLLIILSLSFVLMAGMAEAQPDTLWTRVFGGPGYDLLEYVIPTDEDGFYLRADISRRAENEQKKLFFFNQNGEIESITPEEGEFSLYPVAAQGDLLIAVGSDSGGIHRYYWINSDGETVRRVDRGPFPHRPHPDGIHLRNPIIAANGDLIIQGRSQFEDGFAPLIFRMSPEGDSLWFQEYRHEPRLKNEAIIECANGDIASLNMIFSVGQWLNQLLFTRFSSDGTILSETILQDSIVSASTFYELPNGNFVSCGWWSNSFSFRILTLTPDGDIVSISAPIRYNERMNMAGKRALKDNHIIFYGYTEHEDAYLAKTGIAGNLIWEMTVPGRFDMSYVPPVIPLSDGGFLFGATKISPIDYDPDGSDIILMRFDHDQNYVDSPNATPGVLMLLSAYPNPCNSSAVIDYQIDRPGFVKLGIYDVSGRMVETLTDGFSPIASERIVWNGASLPAGQYQIMLTSPSGSKTTGVTLVK